MNLVDIMRENMLADLVELEISRLEIEDEEI